MKGLVFTEFVELVESMFGEDMMDRLIDETKPLSDGAYTTVGNYDFSELQDYLVCLSEHTGISIDKLLHTFGSHLANAFTQKFAEYFVDAGNTIELLKRVDEHIHVEVQKIYPDAVLPKFTYHYDGSCFVLHYQSTRALATVAHGLIEGVSKYYNETFVLTRKDWQENDQYHCIFTMDTQS